MSLQDADEGLAGELAALTRVEDYYDPWRVSSSSSATTQKSVSSVLEARQDSTRLPLTAVPFHYRHHVHKPSGQRDVAEDVRPHLVWPVDRQAAQTVGIDPVPLALNDGTWQRIVMVVQERADELTLHAISWSPASSGSYGLVRYLHD